MPVFFKLKTDFLNGVSATSVVSIYWWYIFYLDTRWRKAQFFLDDCNKYHPNINFTHDSNRECITFLDFADSVLDNKGWYTYDVHENCPIFKTTHTLVHLRPKFFHPLDLGWTSHFRRTPSVPLSFSPNDNQSIKRKDNPWMTIICYQDLPSGQLLFSVSTH